MDSPLERQGVLEEGPPDIEANVSPLAPDANVVELDLVVPCPAYQPTLILFQCERMRIIFLWCNLRSLWVFHNEESAKLKSNTVFSPT